MFSSIWHLARVTSRLKLSLKDLEVIETRDFAEGSYPADETIARAKLEE